MVYMHALFAAIRIYAQRGEDKREFEGHTLNSHAITLLIMENHGKIMELCF